MTNFLIIKIGVAGAKPYKHTQHLTLRKENVIANIKNSSADKKQRGSIIEYIANNAENSFYTNKVLITSWVYRCNCTVTEISKKRTIQRYMYSPPGRTERQRPAYNGIWNAIVCVSYSQHPIMAEEKRSQESGSTREKT